MVEERSQTGKPVRLWVNGLSAGSGGGLSVARGLSWSLARDPTMHVTLHLIAGHALHEELKHVPRPGNLHLAWADHQALKPWWRDRYENGEFARQANQLADLVLQLNGMLVPKLTIPSLVHFQDPQPYRPITFRGMKDRVIAALKRRRLGRSLRGAAAIGWTSSYLRQLICEHHNLPLRGVVYYNGIPDEWIERDLGHAQPSLQPRLLTVSNVNEYKRQALVVQALPVLLKQIPTLKYDIVGAIAPAFERTMRTLVAELKVEDAVTITGRVSDAEIDRYYQSADAFVLMSVCESFGIPAVEAISYGLPVVAADCCAIPEVIGDAGLRVPEDNLQALIAALHTVLTDPAARAKAIAAGRERCRQFRWSTVADHMAADIRKLVAR